MGIVTKWPTQWWVSSKGGWGFVRFFSSASESQDVKKHSTIQHGFAWMFIPVVLEAWFIAGTFGWAFGIGKSHLDEFQSQWNLSSGKRLNNYGKSPFSMGKSTISMAIFNSYVSHYQRLYLYQSHSQPLFTHYYSLTILYGYIYIGFHGCCTFSPRFFSPIPACRWGRAPQDVEAARAEVRVLQCVPGANISDRTTGHSLRFNGINRYK